MKILAALIILCLYFSFSYSVYGQEYFSEIYEGKASWYWDKPCGDRKFCTTYSGYDFSACANWIERHSILVVWTDTNVIAIECTDRGHFEPLGRQLDLSANAFRKLAPLSKGIINVNFQVYEKEILDR